MFDRHNLDANTKTRPKGIAKTIWGGEEALKEALRNGEAWENQGGTISWSEQDEHHIRGNDTKWELPSSKELTGKEKTKAETLLEQLGMGSKMSSLDKTQYEAQKGRVPPACYQQLAKVSQLHYNFMIENTLVNMCLFCFVLGNHICELF